METSKLALREVSPCSRALGLFLLSLLLPASTYIREATTISNNSWEQGSVTGTQQYDPQAKIIFLGWEVIKHQTGENEATGV